MCPPPLETFKLRVRPYRVRRSSHRDKLFRVRLLRSLGLMKMQSLLLQRATQIASCLWCARFYLNLFVISPYPLPFAKSAVNISFLSIKPVLAPLPVKASTIPSISHLAATHSAIPISSSILHHTPHTPPPPPNSDMRSFLHAQAAASPLLHSPDPPLQSRLHSPSPPFLAPATLRPCQTMRGCLQ